MRLPALLCVLLCATAAAEEKPTRARLRSAFEGNLRSVVEVAGTGRRGLGVIVGASGEVLTAAELVSAKGARVKLGAEEQEGKVVMEDAQLKVALVALAGSDFPAAPVRPEGPLPRGSWLIAIRRGKAGALEPKVGQVRKGASGRSPFVETNLAPLEAGSPVFDSKGRLVGLCAQARGDGCRVLPLLALKAQLLSGATR